MKNGTQMTLMTQILTEGIGFLPICVHLRHQRHRRAIPVTEA
jgi:hypothetical protein